MLSLNRNALQELLLESEDILAESGKIQTIWNHFTENVNFGDMDNFVLRTILISLDKNVIPHLKLSDEECEACINNLCKMMHEFESTASYDLLINFLVALSQALNDYSTIRVKFDKNITINMRESEADVSFLDEASLLQRMMQFDFVRDAELQSLLDDERAGIDTVFDSIKRHLGKGSSSGHGDSDTKGLPRLTELFGTNVDEILLNVRGLIVDGVDRFPDSAKDITKLLYVVQDSATDQIGRLYHQGDYFANLSDLKVLAATSQYVADSLEADTNTAMYILSSADEKLNKLMQTCGSVPVLTISKMVILSMLLRYVKMGDGTSPTTKTTIASIQAQLNKLLADAGTESSSALDKTINPQFPQKELDDYAFIDSNSLWKFACGTDGLTEDLKVAGEELASAMTDLLTELHDIQCEVTECSQQTIAVSNAVLGGLSVDSLSSPETGSEQGSTGKRAAEGMVNAWLACADNLHGEFTGALLSGDRVKAADLLAREMALLALPPDTISHFRENELRSSKERLERDISTYTALLERVHGGVNGRLESAKDRVQSFIKAKTT